MNMIISGPKKSAQRVRQASILLSAGQGFSGIKGGDELRRLAAINSEGFL